VNKVTAIMLGDVSGAAGLGALFLGLSGFIKETKADIVVCNGENSAGGFGITPDEYYRMKECGVSVVTSGNHIWQKDTIYPLLDSEETLLRPANYPAKDVPGHGYTIFDTGKFKVGVVNLQGRVFMPQIECPFKTGLSIVEKLRKQTNLILVDFHAEDTAEKEALSYCLDGKVSVFAGTHTHVQTADARILPGGTGYITDLGLTGVQERIIGSDVELAIQRQITQLPIKSAVAEGKGVMQGIVATIDAESGVCLSIEPFSR
jgi:Uncharacterized protein conserved in bacteria